MKKLVYFCTMLVMMFIASACSDNSPSGALKSYTKAYIDGDYEKYVDGIYFSKVEGEDLAEAKSNFVEFIKAFSSGQSEKDVLKDIEIISEELSEDGNSAIVKIKEIYKDGSEKEKESKMVKVDGKWLMDMGK